MFGAAVADEAVDEAPVAAGASKICLSAASPASSSTLPAGN